MGRQMRGREGYRLETDGKADKETDGETDEKHMERQIRYTVDVKQDQRQMGRQTRDIEGNRLEKGGKAGKREMRRQTRGR